MDSISINAACVAAASLANSLKQIISVPTFDKDGLGTRYERVLTALETSLHAIADTPPTDPAEVIALREILTETQSILARQGADYGQNKKSSSPGSRTDSRRRVLWAIRDKERLSRTVADLESLVQQLTLLVVKVRITGPRTSTSLTVRSSVSTVSLPTPATGLQICRRPTGNTHDIDIIFIHGLGSTSASTWGAFNVNWPIDLLPQDFPSARILTFDYSIGPLSIIRRGKVQLEAKSLITNIEIKAQEEPVSVPVVFIAHSFGGLVLKSALAYCHKSQSFDDSSRSLLYRTRGIVLMGVPSLQGTSPIWLRDFLTRVDVSTQSSNHSTTFQLATQSTSELSDMFKADSELFRSICSTRGWSVVNFYETDRTRTRLGPFAITSESNISFQDTIGFLEGDHFSMCKFQTRDDNSYVNVTQKLRGMLTGYLPRVDSFSSRAPAKVAAPVSEILQESLIFKSKTDNYVYSIRRKLTIIERLDEFLNALGDPFDIKSNQAQSLVPLPTWVLEHPAYKSWTMGSPIYLHLCGPAGTGKTYLTRQIARSLTSAQITVAKTPPNITVVTHFVDWRWYPQNVPESMLRSFIFQILKMHPDLFRLIIHRPEYQLNAYDDLQSLFFHLLGRLAEVKVYIIIDGLEDAYEGVQATVCDTLTKIAKRSRHGGIVKVLITSRSRVADGGINVEPEAVQCLDLRSVAHHGVRNREIRAYIENAVSAIPIGHKISVSTRDQIKNSLCEQTIFEREKFRGEFTFTDDQSPLNNFVWISAAVSLIISKTTKAGIDMVVGRISDGGQTIREFYQQMIEDLTLPGNVDFRKILRFLLVARRPMSVTELEFALTIQKDHRTLQNVVNAQKLSLREILEEQAAGLVVFEDDRVCLIHRRLKVYLKRSHYYDEAQGNSELALACLRTLLLEPSTSPGPDRGHAEFSSDKIDLEPPESVNVFAEYCNSFWFKHVQKAADISVVPLCRNFMHSVDYEHWQEAYLKGHPRLRLPKRERGSWVHRLAGLDLLRNKGLMDMVRSDLEYRDVDFKWAPIHFAVTNETRKTTEILTRLLSKEVADYRLLQFASMAGKVNIMAAVLDFQTIEIDPSILVDAVKGRHHAAFEFLIQHFEKHGPYVLREWNWNTWRDREGGVLHHCTRARNFDAVTQVVSYGANPSVKIGGRTALHTAAQVGEIDILRFFLDFNPSLLTIVEDECNNTALHLAAEVGFFDGVREILNNMGEVNVENKTRQTPLALAAKGGHVSIVKLLLAFGADVNAGDDEGNTPIHLASAVSWCEVVELLLNAGADPNARDDRRRTPLYLAAANGALDIVMVLLYSGADLNAADQHRQTPLHIAAMRGMADIVLELIKAGVTINKVDRDGKTPLHLAVNSDFPSPKIVEALVIAGAQTEAKDDSGLTPYDYARDKGSSYFQAILADALDRDEKAMLGGGRDRRMSNYDRIVERKAILEPPSHLGSRARSATRKVISESY